MLPYDDYIVSSSISDIRVVEPDNRERYPSSFYTTAACVCLVLLPVMLAVTALLSLLDWQQHTNGKALTTIFF